MKTILQFLSGDGAFLYEACGCRFVDSIYSPTFGGTGSVTLRNEVMTLRFWLERDRLFLDIKGCAQDAKDSWCSMDILWQLITGEISDDGSMTRTNTIFLRDQFGEIQERFTRGNLERTEKTFKALKAARAKRMFG